VAGEVEYASGTSWSATSPTGRCCGPSGPTSTAGPPAGSRPWPRTGPRAGPSCSPTTTGPPCRSPAAAGTEPPGLADRDLAALREAGDRAAALGGWETAARFYAERWSSGPSGDPARGPLLLRLGRARCRGEMAGHDELDRGRAGPAGRRRAGGRGRGRDAARRAGLPPGRGGDREAATDRALALVAGAPPSATKAAVLRGAMMHLVVASRHAEGLAVGRQVLAMARDARPARPGGRRARGDRHGQGRGRRPGGLDDLEAAIARFEELGTPGGPSGT
jgi:hypothetical protein